MRYKNRILKNKINKTQINTLKSLESGEKILNKKLKFNAVNIYILHMQAKFGK